MKKIHVLPTKKPSRLQSQMNGKYHLENGQTISLKSYQNIYITCDEEIKDGDWCFYLGRFGAKIVCKAKLTDTGFVYQEFGEDYVGREDEGITPLKSEIFKIILTTDQDLIKDGVQAIDDEFLEWFVKHPSCEFVEVDKEEDELVSPKNPKIRFNYLQDPPSFISAESLNNMILTYKYKIIIPQEEPKQETLEEACKRIKNELDYSEFDYTSFKLGAKWQQEQDKNKYSEEEMLDFSEWVSHNDWVYLPSKGYWVNEEQEELEENFTTKELFEQFKNK